MFSVGGDLAPLLVIYHCVINDPQTWWLVLLTKQGLVVPDLLCSLGVHSRVSHWIIWRLSHWFFWLVAEAGCWLDRPRYFGGNVACPCSCPPSSQQWTSQEAQVETVWPFIIQIWSPGLCLLLCGPSPSGFKRRCRYHFSIPRWGGHMGGEDISMAIFAKSMQPHSFSPTCQSPFNHHFRVPITMYPLSLQRWDGEASVYLFTSFLLPHAYTHTHTHTTHKKKLVNSCLSCPHSFHPPPRQKEF